MENQIQMKIVIRFLRVFCAVLSLWLLDVSFACAKVVQSSNKKTVTKKRASNSKKAKKTTKSAKKSSGAVKPNAGTANSAKSSSKTNKDGINHLASHNFWSVHAYKENGKQVCFIATKPQSSKGNYKKRDEVFLMITHRSASGGVRDELSFVAGYPLKEGASVTLSIDGVDYKMPVVKDSNAWTENSESDKEVVAAMMKGTKLVVKGVSQRGTATTDTFSLSGVTAALKRADKECGIKR